MFYSSPNIENIPFEINCANKYMDMTSMFYGCKKLKELPKINNVKASILSRFANNCSSLKIIPYDYFNAWDFSKISNASSAYSGDASYMFYHCLN